jgi:hypothetical protein
MAVENIEWVLSGSWVGVGGALMRHLIDGCDFVDVIFNSSVRVINSGVEV